LVGGGLASPPLTTEIYSPVTKSWSLAAPMKVHRGDARGVLLSNHKVLVAGGYSSPDGRSWPTAELFTP
jgi:hypothetical protein